PSLLAGEGSRFLRPVLGVHPIPALRHVREAHARTLADCHCGEAPLRGSVALVTLAWRWGSPPSGPLSRPAGTTLATSARFMGLDAILKRWSPVFLCLMLAVIAYFQAVGIGQLLSTVLVSSTSIPTSPARAGGKAAARDPDHHTSADVILARNPFDSVAGP